MKQIGPGILPASEIYFSSPSQKAKKLYYNVLCAGHFYCDNNYRLVRDNYDSILVLYVVSGSFTFVTADGVIMAEPAAGLLSPSLNAEFSVPFVKEIFEEINGEDFIICYHNCGNAVGNMTKEIAALGADIYHFGNAISLKDIIPLMPKNAVVMGNVDPVLFRNGTADDIKKNVQKVYDECSVYGNFMLSSGCDIPAQAKWENIDAYFEKVEELYK